MNNVISQGKYNFRYGFVCFCYVEENTKESFYFHGYPKDTFYVF